MVYTAAGGVLKGSGTDHVVLFWLRQQCGHRKRWNAVREDWAEEPEDLLDPQWQKVSCSITPPSCVELAKDTFSAIGWHRLVARGR